MQACFDFSEKDFFLLVSEDLDVLNGRSMLLLAPHLSHFFPLFE